MKRGHKPPFQEERKITHETIEIKALTFMREMQKLGFIDKLDPDGFPSGFIMRQFVFQAAGRNRTSMGNSSSRPASMLKESTSLLKPEKWE